MKQQQEKIKIIVQNQPTKKEAKAKTAALSEQLSAILSERVQIKTNILEWLHNKDI